MPTSVLSYKLIAGEEFERDVYVKNRRTRRVMVPVNPRAMLRLQGTTGPGILSFDTSVTYGNGIRLCIAADDTWNLAAGTYEFDVVATIEDQPRTVATGTVEVTVPDRVTPLDGSTNMLIAYKQRTDYRLTFTWQDSSGDLLLVDDAQLHAVDDNDAIVLDLDWFATAPDEVTIAALPGISRGYLAPKTDVSLEMHISNTNTVAAGSYAFDLMGKAASTGDWDVLASGVLEVARSITVVD